MITTVKGLRAGETVKAFHLAKAQPWMRYREQPPSTPLITGAADVNGTLAIDLPQWTPIALVRTDGTAIVVENATTKVVNP
jgi:hypothetical protein